MVISEGAEYTTPPRKAILIKAIGTDATSASHLKVEGSELGDLISTVAPMHKTSSNLLGPLRLGSLYYVIPPDSEFEWEGASGSKARLIGSWVFLDPGESLPSDMLSRYEAQKDHYMTYVEGSYSHGTDTALTAGAEVTVLTISPAANEKYVLNGPVMADVENYTPSEGDLAIRMKYDETYLDTTLKDSALGGIDILSAPRPPADTTEEEPFSLAGSPITVEPNHKLYFLVKNTSGASISPASGTSLTFTITAIVEYHRG